MSVTCKHCGGIYVDKVDEKETYEAKVTTYYCQSCKQKFEIKQTKQSGDVFLMKFLGFYGVDSYGRIRNGSDEYVEIHRNGNDTICFQAHSKTTTHVVPKIYVYYYANTHRHSIRYDSFRSMNDSLGAFQDVDYIVLSDELTKQALTNGAMRAIYNEKGNLFKVRDQENLMLLNDIVSWLTSVLGPSTIMKPSSKSSNGCYIATAVYGSYDCPEVWTLRRYRDFELRKNAFGRMFIKIYYAISPVMVKMFGNKEAFRKIWRKKLDKMVKELQEKGYDCSPYTDA